MADEILKNIEMLPDEVEFVSDLKAIVYTAKAKAYQVADLYNVASNWLVGRQRLTFLSLPFSVHRPLNWNWRRFSQLICLGRIAERNLRIANRQKI